MMHDHAPALKEKRTKVSAVLKAIDDLIAEYPDCIHDVMMAAKQACTATAEHIRDNWQDSPSAKGWEQAARLIDRTDDRISRII